jgi:hypothetical protein
MLKNYLFMHLLEFHQNDDKHGSCRVIFNGQEIDGCDMNYSQRYTQAHICIANVMQTLKTKDIKVEIIGHAAVGQYPISELMTFAESLLNEQFEPHTHLTRTYTKLNLAAEKSHEQLDVLNITEDRFRGYLEETLEKEFSKLGFNYQEIKANGTRMLDNQRLEMFVVDYFNIPHPVADGLAVIFTIQLPDSDQSPMIESMQTALFNDSLYKEFTPLIEKIYLSQDTSFQIKEDVIKDLSALLKLKQQADKGLVKEFIRLGFDFTDLLKSGERVNENVIFLSKELVNDARLAPGSNVRFSFSVINSPNNQGYSIEHLTVVMRENASDTNYRVLFENDYFYKNAPLPTIEEIFNQIIESEKICKIKETFKMNEKQFNSELNTNLRTTKRNGL